MENNKYKLVQIISHTDSVVQPITEDNKPYLDTLCTYEDDRITYAIYENKGDNVLELNTYKLAQMGVDVIIKS